MTSSRGRICENVGATITSAQILANSVVKHCEPALRADFGECRNCADERRYLILGNVVEELQNAQIPANLVVKHREPAPRADFWQRRNCADE
ncbi:MAG: hypothetical protein ACI4JT_07610 [Oscillospiraceae bacterium]